MFHSRIVSLLIILLSTSLISACGGGGGSTVPPPDNEPPSDNEPPTDTNTAPVANNQSPSTDENTALAITLTGSDADGDSLSFTVSTNPANGALSGTAPDLTYTPNADYAGSDSFNFIANDGTEDSAEATISITVNPLYTIGGTVTGAVNPGLTLENNGDDNLEVGGIGFEFPTQLADGSSYAVTLAALPEHQLCSVDNATGTVAAADVDDVSVLCRYWRTAGLIEEDDVGDAGSPQIVFDSDGNAIAVWIQYDGAQANVWANTYSPDSGWGTAVLIGDDTGDAAAPQIAVDGDGNAIAVWTQQGTYSNVWINHYSPDSGWGGEGLLEHNEGEASNPQIAFDNAGNAIAVWEQNGDPLVTPNPLNIWANTFSPDSGWGTAVLVENDPGSAQVPQIAFDNAGNAIAVWHQYDGSTQFIIRANIWSPDSNWGSAERIETNTSGNSFGPQIVIDSADNATVVWASNDGTRYNTWANTYSPDSDWGSAELIETDNAGNAFDPQIAVDSVGNVIAVWRQQDDIGGYNIWANTYSPDGGWGSAELIETDGGSAGGQQIAFDNIGNAIAVWRSFSIRANTWSPGSGWDTETLIETDNAGSATDPQIVFDNAGNAIAVWAQNDGTRDNIQVNHFE